MIFTKNCILSYHNDCIIFFISLSYSIANNFLKRLARETSGRYHKWYGNFDIQMFIHKLLMEGFKDTHVSTKICCRYYVKMQNKRVRDCNRYYIYIYIYIVIHWQTVLLYHNSSVWLDLWDASSQDWNLANFTSVRYLTLEPSLFSS